MSYAEDILKLRARVQDAVSKGLVNKEGKNFFEATLIQIMNDSEKQRLNCLTQAENLRRQAAIFDGQSAAFGSVTSIIFNVINGYVILAEKDQAERAAQESEKNEEVILTENAEESSKKGRKKKV